MSDRREEADFSFFSEIQTRMITNTKTNRRFNDTVNQVQSETYPEVKCNRRSGISADSQMHFSKFN